MNRQSKDTYTKIKSNNSREKVRSRKRKVNIFWIAIIFIIVLIVTTFPMFVNYIVLYNGDKFDWLKPNGIVSGNNQWVGFLASYSGSILGGIIGGAMTLIGVRLTINNKNKEDMINMYPSKRIKIKDFKKIISNLDKKFNPLFSKRVTEYNLNDTKEYVLKINEIVREFETEEKISENAGEVNGFLLMVILDFVELNNDIYDDFVISDGYYTFKDSVIENIFLNLKLNWSFVLNAVDEECKSILLEMEDVILKK